MKQLASRAQLEDYVIILPRFREVDETDNVGMVQLTHDLNFFEDICSLHSRRGISRSSFVSW